MCQAITVDKPHAVFEHECLHEHFPQLSTEVFSAANKVKDRIRIHYPVFDFCIFYLSPLIGD